MPSVGRISVGNLQIFGTPYTAPPPLAPGLTLTFITATSLRVVASGNPPEGFGTVVGYNFYLDGVKNNTEIYGTAYEFTGLTASTEYNLTFTFVNGDDDESEQVGLLTASTLPTPAIPTDFPMDSDRRGGIDQIVSEGRAFFPDRPGVAVSTTGSAGKYTRAYGRAARGTTARALSVDDHFRIASNTKPFTAYAIMQQLDAETISLDDKLADYVSGVPQGNNITIEHMLTMRSGIFDYSGSGAPNMVSFALNPKSAWTREKSLLSIRSNPSQFTPGSAFQYSNSNFVLLGMILEQVTGKPIAQVITEDVITPLGLTETSWPTTTSLPAPFTKGYGLNPLYSVVASIPIIGAFLAASGLFGGKVRDETAMSPGVLDAAGCLVSTIGDLRKFAEHMREGTLLSPETHALWLASGESNPVAYTEEGPEFYYYGYGMFRMGSWHGHDGSWFGFSSACMFEETSESAVAVMENYQTPGLLAFSRFWYRIANYLHPTSADEDGYDYDPPEELPTAPITYTGNITGGTVPHLTHLYYRARLAGRGGGGGGGQRVTGSAATKRGGGGGGGAAVIDTGIRPIAELGATFDLVEGTGGLAGSSPESGAGIDGGAGTASSLTSGTVTLIANGGGPGLGGPTSGSGGAGGAGGTASVTGLTGLDIEADGTAGAAGANSNVAPAAAPNNSDGGAAGGGGGGGMTGGSNTQGPGGRGGDSRFQSGGAGGLAGTGYIGGSTPLTDPGKAGAGPGGGAASVTSSTGGGTPGALAGGYGAGGAGGGARGSSKLAGLYSLPSAGGPALARIDFLNEDEPPQPVQFLNANTSTTGVVTIPAHAVGDIIVIWAYDALSTTIPAIPDAGGTVPAWTSIDGDGGGGDAARLAYFVATSTDHTSGTWGGSSGGVRTIAAVFTGQHASSPIGGHALSGAATGTVSVAPSITMADTSGRSALLHFHGSRLVDGSAWAAPAPGYTRRAETSSQAGVCLNTKDATTSDGSNTQGDITSIRFRGATLEIRPAV
jgi:CubicO group peptidase (beta-lactamase class C family)